MQQLEEMIVGNLAGKSWALKKSDMAMGKEHGTPLQKREIFGGNMAKSWEYLGKHCNSWEFKATYGKKYINGGLNGNIIFIYVICSIAIY